MKESKESSRLRENKDHSKDWHKWGPYLSERQWGTVREDYSADGSAWDYFPHDHARSRVYRWGEDGLGGFSDRHQELCFAFALWNGKDPILKERFFGLTSSEGNHGEDVKELYYYLDNTPTHSYMKMLYKYPQEEYPYNELLQVNEQRKSDRKQGEYELYDTGIFKEDNYWDIQIEFAKADEEDICIKLTAYNQSAETATLTVLPTLWFRNRWMFGLFDKKPSIELTERRKEFSCFETKHKIMGSYSLYFDAPERILFTENETNNERLFNVPNKTPFVKDAFHRAVIHEEYDFIKDKTSGTKAAPLYMLQVNGHQSAEIKLRFCKEKLNGEPFVDFDSILKKRIEETNEFYDIVHGNNKNEDYRNIQRQALAGLLWSKQYYNYTIEDWLKGDSTMPPPPTSRLSGRNCDWKYLDNADIISMPDKWEYPWYATWDLGFHCVTMALVDPEFAKHQLILIMREWYMQPNGQIPAYEWSFNDTNPPVQAWAALKVYQIDQKKNGNSDIDFLKRIFSKLLLNFTWWVNRKDEHNRNIFEGGFLGLDNIGLFDRSHLPKGIKLEEADATSWMAMYAGNMLGIALEIAMHDPSYEDVTTKFYEHFQHISEAFNQFDENKKNLWNEKDGFFYDVAVLPNEIKEQIQVRTVVGLSCLFGVSIIKNDYFLRLKKFHSRLEWFRNMRQSKGKLHEIEKYDPNKDVLLSIIPKEKLLRILEVMLDETEFLSDYGIRSVSKYYAENPYSLILVGQKYELGYEPAESTVGMFGGNSNWRGPLWVPINYLILESLDTYYEYYGDTLKVEFPRHSGVFLNLNQVMKSLAQRMLNKYLPDKDGNRPIHGRDSLYNNDPNFKGLLLFYEYFHGDTGKGLGASHQTGWTSIISELIDRLTNE
jgi:hypothetical protein